jgi:hypothetical protein
MTITRTGLAAGISPEPSALELEILMALVRVQETNDREEKETYPKKQIAAILRAVAASDLFAQSDATADPEFGQIIADAAASITAHVEEMERPNSRLEEDILMRLRAVPTEKALAKRYREPRDIKCVRRRGVLRAVLDAVWTNTFLVPDAEDFEDFEKIENDIIDPKDRVINPKVRVLSPEEIEKINDITNRSDFSTARRDFHFDCERLDAGLKATHCLIEAGHEQNDLIKPVTQRDALIWAMVAIDTGAGHPVHKTQSQRLNIAAEYTSVSRGTLGQYLKELRKGVAWTEVPKFSEQEHALFKAQSERIRKLASSPGQGWELVLPALKGIFDSALPKPSSAGQIRDAKKVTSDE